MLQRFEGHFSGFDETELFFQTWSKEPVQGTIVITHGLAEHSECYHPLAKVLAENGWNVIGWDLRGHGRSEGKRGFASDFSNFRKDLALLIQNLRKNNKAPTPLILFGHSMGGLVTLQYLAQKEEPQPDAAVLSSPALGIKVAVPALKVKVAEIAEKWLPSLTLGNEISYSDISRDQKVIASYDRDTLRHDKISPGVFLGMQRGFLGVAAHPEKIDLPVMFQIAGDDRIVSAEASRELFTHLPNKKNQLHVYPESFHEIYNDLDRDAAIADLKKFLGTFKKAT